MASASGACGLNRKLCGDRCFVSPLEKHADQIQVLECASLSAGGKCVTARISHGHHDALVEMHHPFLFICVNGSACGERRSRSWTS